VAGRRSVRSPWRSRRYCWTATARRYDRSTLYSSAPVASVWPSMRTILPAIEGSLSTAASVSSTGYAAGGQLRRVKGKLDAGGKGIEPVWRGGRGRLGRWHRGQRRGGDEGA